MRRCDNSSDSWKLREWEGSVSGLGFWSHVLSKPGGISVSSVLDSSISNNTSVDGTRYAISLLHVNFGHLEVGLSVGIVFLDISL